jgi:hypothetical protein
MCDELYCDVMMLMICAHTCCCACCCCLLLVLLGRAYLADVAHRHLQSGVFNNVKDAVNYIIKKLRKNRASHGTRHNNYTHHHKITSHQPQQREYMYACA